jgi:hypothetical protein
METYTQTMLLNSFTIAISRGFFESFNDSKESAKTGRVDRKFTIRMYNYSKLGWWQNWHGCQTGVRELTSSPRHFQKQLSLSVG